jgi:hypothetical protein
MAKTDQQYTGWYWWSKKKYGGSKENETESGDTKSNASLELLGASFLYRQYHAHLYITLILKIQLPVPFLESGQQLLVPFYCLYCL